MCCTTAGCEAGRSYVRRWTLNGVVVAAIFAAACEQQVDPRRTNFKIAKDNVAAAFDPASGRLRRIEVDQDRNGIFETVSTWDGNQLKLIEIDTDGDKVVDRWEHYEKIPPVMTKIGSSSRRDGIQDVWTYVSPDGKVITAVERDANRDGRVDKWEEFDPPLTPEGTPVLRRVGYDQTGAGKATRWLYYKPNGEFEKTEAVR